MESFTYEEQAAANRIFGADNKSKTSSGGLRGSSNLQSSQNDNSQKTLVEMAAYEST
jgi:hypothetical protein